MLIEGVWGTVDPAGIPVGVLTDLLTPLARDVRVERLSEEALLWGKEVADERYAVVATM